MQKGSTALAILLMFSFLGLWGCNNQKNSATSLKIRELEARHAKLEEDYRAVFATNEGHRRKIAQLEVERSDLNKKMQDLEAAVRERDELKSQLANRTEERDAVQVQFLQFTRDLQSLAGRAQTAAARPFGNTVNAQSASRKSQ